MVVLAILGVLLSLTLNAYSDQQEKAKSAKDDIVRANNGGYVGKAEDY